MSIYQFKLTELCLIQYVFILGDKVENCKQKPPGDGGFWGRGVEGLNVCPFAGLIWILILVKRILCAVHANAMSIWCYGVKMDDIW